ncbi:MAG: sulfite exporter TauE/SafE family protein [Sphingomonadales bacterium]
MTIAIAIAAFLASLLTLFSGFGLGTLLMPVAAIFLPIAVAIALTALVHLLNNMFKLMLLGRWVDWSVVLWFGLPALLAALPGAWLLTQMAQWPVWTEYHWLGRQAEITPVKLLIGALLIAFAIAEWRNLAKHVAVTPRLLPLGGILSGFFGGLSGHQGAFRSAFLLHAGLDAQAFIATNAAIAMLVDMARLAIYGLNLKLLTAGADISLMAIATAAAFAGIMVGRLGVHKVTIAAIQRLVAAMLLLLGTALMAGII